MLLPQIQTNFIAKFLALFLALVLAHAVLGMISLSPPNPFAKRMPSASAPIAILLHAISAPFQALKKREAAVFQPLEWRLLFFRLFPSQRTRPTTACKTQRNGSTINPCRFVSPW